VLLRGVRAILGEGRRVCQPHHLRSRDFPPLKARFAHSHSGSQFLPHLPSHWNSDILPPHCGQTRLRIDEMMRTFSSLGDALKELMIAVLFQKSASGSTRRRDDGRCRDRFVRS